MGAITAGSTQAVNGAQLFGVAESVAARIPVAGKDVVVEFVVTTDIAWLLGSNLFFLERRQNRLLDSFTAVGINRMGDVSKHSAAAA